MTDDNHVFIAGIIVGSCFTAVITTLGWLLL
jgi:hypothetical protein